MNPSPNPFAAICPRPRVPTRRPRAVARIMGLVDVGLAGLAILAATLVLATLAIFIGSLSVCALLETGRWALAPGGLVPALRLMPLFEGSLVGGAVLGPIACLRFLADLRNQHWL